MSNIAIYTDSTADIDPVWMQEHNVKSINLTYIIDDEEYTDDPDPSAVKAFYDKLREGKMPKTSAVSMQTFKEVFEAELKAGNDVFYTGLSGKLSGTCNNAFMAMEQLNKEYSENQVYVTDSISTSCALFHLIRKAVEMRDAGKAAQEIVDTLDSIKHRLYAFVGLDDLIHLKRGGRISGAAAAIGTVLNIKPVIILDADGGLTVKDKVKGNKKLFKYFLSRIEEYAEDPVEQPIYIICSDVRDGAEELKNAIVKEFSSKNVSINTMGSIVGGHLGPGFLIIVFLAKETREVLGNS